MVLRRAVIGPDVGDAAPMGRLQRDRLGPVGPELQVLLLEPEMRRRGIV
jgi:hypothetical protein